MTCCGSGTGSPAATQRSIETVPGLLGEGRPGIITSTEDTMRNRPKMFITEQTEKTLPERTLLAMERYKSIGLVQAGDTMVHEVVTRAEAAWRPDEPVQA